MKAQVKEWIAVFLIHLILSLPFYVNSVYATPVNETNATTPAPSPSPTPISPPFEGPEGIISISVKGGDGIEGFAKPVDFLTFNVHAALSNEAVTNNNVFLGSAPGIKFDKCSSSISGGVQCSLRIPGSGTDNFETQPFTINLVRGDNTLADSKSGILIVDSKAPKVTLSISKNKFSSQDNVVVDYDATDFACDAEACIDKCVGIKKIDFYTLDGSFKQTVDVAANESTETTEDESADNCNTHSSISIEPKKFKDGRNSIFAKAFDRFNHASQETSVTFDIDTSAPVILQDSFAITRKGIALNTFSLHNVPVDVTVNISGNDLDLGSVKADLSSLNAVQAGQNLKDAKASCEFIEENADGNLSRCTWHIELAPKTAGTKSIFISAADNFGNRQNATISRILSLDDKGPVVQSLSTNVKSGDKALARASGNTVTAVFEEKTGIIAEDVFLHIFVSFQSTSLDDDPRINPSVCSKETGKEASWACVWENLDFGSGFSAKMSIESDTTDVLLNPVSEAKTTEVAIDSKAPVLTGMSITPVGGAVQAFGSIFKIGDKIAVFANLTEENDVIASADFSKFISGAEQVAGTCERVQNDEHVCTWQTDSINLASSGVVTFSFKDNAGNELSVTRKLITFGLENATVPDFWINLVSCSPKTIDRSLGPLIGQRVFCQVKLIPNPAAKKAKKVSTVFISDAECEIDKQIAESFETFNTEAGSTSPIIKITLKKDDFNIDNATVSCALSIFSRVGTGASSTITKNPEIENVKINIGFFNLPLGELSDEVQRKIDDAKDAAEGIWKLIGTLNKLIFYAKKICQIINTLYTIVAALYLAYFVLQGTTFTCRATGIANLFGICDAIKGIAVGECGVTEGGSVTADNIKTTTDKFCDYVNCRKTILWGADVKNFIDNAPTSVISPGQNVGPKTEVQGKGLFRQSVVKKDKEGKSVSVSAFSRPVSEYMDPQHNLLVAILFACLPGIVYGLDKYRQVLCLYADCLQNGVGKEGLPITACEDQKAYATCKYVTSELFALFPWTAVFDHFIGIIKNALSNPFALLGVAVSLACGSQCPSEPLGTGYQLCRGARLFSLVGDAAQNVQDIIENGFTIRQDYCSRLDEGNQTTVPSTEPEVTTSRTDTPTNVNETKRR